MTKQERQILLGQNLQKARKEQHLTREQLAEKVGISVTFCANLECGNKMMSVDTLGKLMDALHVSADYLMGSGTSDSHVQNIMLLLKDQPSETLAFVEKLVRLCVSDLPCEITREEGVQIQDDRG